MDDKNCDTFENNIFESYEENSGFRDISSLLVLNDSDDLLSDNSKEEKNSNWQQFEKKTYPPEKDLMPSVFDVASYILKKLGEMSTMKLQKLVYYCQAWSLVWDEMPLFKENIEAWANGPVIRKLFSYHRGKFRIANIPIGNPDILNDTQKETIDAVLEYYGDMSAQELIDLSHEEEPWRNARKGIPSNVRGNKVIDLDLIAEYYSSLSLED